MKYKTPWQLLYKTRLARMKQCAETPVLASYEGRGFVAHLCVQLLVASKGGTWKALWWHFKHVIRYRWMYFTSGVWRFWYSTVLRFSDDEISEMVDAKYGITPEDSAAAQRMIDEAENGTT